jgi:trigger factor
MIGAAVLSVTETRNEGLQRTYQISVPASELDKAINDRLVALNGKVKVAGFRPGKVPLQVLKARYGDSVQGEAIEDAVRKSSADAIRQQNLKPALQPNIKITSWAPGQNLEYTLEVELVPDVPQVALDSLSIETIALELPESRITEALERLVKANTKFEPITKARAAQNGDKVKIDFTGRINGVEFAGGKAEGYALELGAGRLIPGFEDQIVGMKKGETRDITVTFPADYPSEDTAGKEAVFTIVLHEIEQAIPRTLDEDLAKEMGHDSVEALKAETVKRLQDEMATIPRSYNKRKLLDALDAATAFELPPTLVAAELHSVWDQVHDADGEHTHGHEEHHLPEEDAAKLRPIAIRRVKLGLVLADIGSRNGVTVSEEEVRRAIWQEAMRYPGQVREVLDFFQKNPQAINSVRAPLYEDKVIDFIFEKVKTTVKTMSEEAFLKLAEDEEKAEEAALGKPGATAEETSSATTTPAKPKKAASKSKKADTAEGAA